ncbi:hypothetical protein M0R88_17460 [Halorussus gelatinilyticus]|uniref:Uncharacterized protein n=1 Tax=Halorussus gelatinilyticus TaxID=2937524 RepID=A0A8U0IH35_9EURY|nr:hypothetical protein [Halorussus gelatinilyticus]UPW00283.1 hypothetical protein M0R88_17460 [Halorussus gelatinilyticus]
MRRRPFLRLAGATTAAATSVGVLGASRSSDGSRNEQASGGDSARSPAGTRLAATDRALSVRRARTFDHVVRLNDLGDDPRGRITAFSALSEREREVVASAIEGTYRTRDPPEWLCEFASATPFVERAGTYYRLDDTLPTYRVTAEAVAERDVAGEVATYEAYERAVTREEYVASGLLRIARREGIELGYVWPTLREFFERYDAARYHGEVLDFAVEVDGAGPPAELSATEVGVETAVGGAVWNADAAPERTRKLVRRAGRARGAYGFDRAPAGLLDALRDHRYVALGGTFYASYVESDGPVPVSVSATVREGRLRLAVRNDGDREVRLASGPPRPFGVVRCRAAGDTGGDGHVLWTDAYAASDRVRTAGRDVTAANDVALLSTLAPGESLAERYAVPADLPAGEYVVEGSLGVERDGTAEGGTGPADGGTGPGEGGTEPAEGSTVQYRVTFAVE